MYMVLILRQHISIIMQYTFLLSIVLRIDWIELISLTVGFVNLPICNAVVTVDAIV